MWRCVIVPIVLDVSGGLGAFSFRIKQTWAKSITLRSWQLTNLWSTLTTLTFAFDTGAFQQNTPPRFSSTQLHVQPMTVFAFHITLLTTAGKCRSSSSTSSQIAPLVLHVSSLHACDTVPLVTLCRVWHCAACDTVPLGEFPRNVINYPPDVTAKHPRRTVASVTVLSKSKQPSVTVLRDLSLYFATTCM